MNETDAILTFNIGSSSLKFALFRGGANTELRVADGIVGGIGTEGGQFKFRFEARSPDARDARCKDHETAMLMVVNALSSAKCREPVAIGHRIVHGGAKSQAHAEIDAALLAALRLAVPFAPLHLPAEINGIETATKAYPRATQVACFDTSFHRDLPEIARRFPLPRGLYDDGILRYGFHGLSYEYIVQKLGQDIRRRTIVAHLGNGASMVALKDGRSVETTMGLTPAGGLMSGTRSGDLDPGILLHLARTGHSIDDLERIVNYQSGWLGISGVSSDMRTIETRRPNDAHAELAFEMFCYQARKSIGALAAVLGGIDALVFTGGVGSGSAAIRAEICGPLACFGIHLDQGKNLGAEGVISEAGAPCQIRVLPTDEEIVIARHTRRIVGAKN